MTKTLWDNEPPSERVFLDASVLQDRTANDLLMTLAGHGVFEPRWCREVLDRLPATVRVASMGELFPYAEIIGYQGLARSVRADPENQLVLAAAQHDRCKVLLTENPAGFNPPSTGPYPVGVERLSPYLSRTLAEQPARVYAALRSLPVSPGNLIDHMTGVPGLRMFADGLRTSVDRSRASEGQQ